MGALVPGKPTCRVATEEAKKALATPGAPYRLHHSTLHTVSNLQLACNAVKVIIRWCCMSQPICASKSGPTTQLPGC